MASMPRPPAPPATPRPSTARAARGCCAADARPRRRLGVGVADRQSFSETPERVTAGRPVMSSFRSSITAGGNRPGRTPGPACSLPGRSSRSPQAPRPPRRLNAARIRALPPRGRPASVPPGAAGEPGNSQGRQAGLMHRIAQERENCQGGPRPGRTSRDDFCKGWRPGRNAPLSQLLLCHPARRTWPGARQQRPVLPRGRPGKYPGRSERPRRHRCPATVHRSQQVVASLDSTHDTLEDSAAEVGEVTCSPGPSPPRSGAAAARRSG